MKNEGLYIKLLPGGKIKRRLVTILGEVPLADTTIAEELICLIDANNVSMYQAIKDIWACSSYVDRSPRALREFERVLSKYLHWLRSRNLIRYVLFMTTYEDLDEKPDYRTPEGATKLANLLTDSMGPDYVVDRTLYTLSRKDTFDLDGNKKLIERYPFLLPQHSLSETCSTNFESTELDAMPVGWRIAFGEDICKEIMEELVRNNCVDSYRILQIKEKYGELRWYSQGGTERIHREIVPKYEKMSR